MMKPSCLLLASALLCPFTIQAQTPPSNVTLNRSAFPHLSFGSNDATLVDGDRLSLFASASGSFPIDYEFLRDGNRIANSASGFHALDARLETAGTYSVIASNAAGSAASGSFTLTVVPKPRIQAELTPGAAGPGALVGGSVSIVAQLPAEVSVSNGQFYRNDVPVGQIGDTVLNLSNVTLADASTIQYRVTYQNINGFDRFVRSSSFRLKVYQSFTAPIIVTQPLNQMVAPGGAATLAVGAAGAGPFRYQWRKDGNAIANATGFALRLSNAQAGDAGNYSVSVLPAAGVPGSAINSAVAAINVASHPAPDPTADSLVVSARASLSQHSNAFLDSADITLDAALQNDADHPTANFFKAATQLADLVNEPAFAQFFDRLGVDAAGRDLYNWTANVTRDPDGSLTAPANVTTQELTAFSRTNAIPRIRAAISHLETIIDTDFTVSLTPNEVGRNSSGSPFVEGGGRVTLDQGDLHLIRAALSFAEYLLITADSWDLNVLLTTVDSLNDLNQLNLQTILQQHPQLLQFRDTSQLNAARSALEKSVDAYILGMAIVRTRPTTAIRLFNLDSEESQRELEFRRNFLELKGSLDTVLTVNESPQFRVNYAKTLDGAASPRSLSPSFFENTPIGGTAVDPSLNGAVSAIGKPRIIIRPVGMRAPLNGSVTIGVTAVGGAPINGANQPSLTIPSVSATDYAAYSVRVSNQHGSVQSHPAVIARPGGAVIAWGLNATQTNLPPHIRNLTAVAAGRGHAIGSLADGTAVGWGENTFGQASPPFGLTDVVAVAAGGHHSLALRSNGQITGWGNNSSGQAATPGTLINATAIAAGENHSLALKSDGTVTAWGFNSSGQSSVPAGLNNVVAIAAGDNHSLALTVDGRVVGWGANHRLQTNAPPGLRDVVAIAAGGAHSLALRSNGTVTAWGANDDGQVDVPANLPRAIAIAAGGTQSFALHANGAISGWGETTFTISDSANSLIPVGLSGVTQITAGFDFAVAIGPVLITGGPQDLNVNEGDTATFRVANVTGTGPLSYQWRFNGADIVGAHSLTLTLTNVQSSAAGNYALAVDDGVSITASRPAKLTVNANNDAFATPRAFPGGGGRLLGSTAAASREPGEPRHGGDAGGASLWFSWTAPTSVNVNIDTIGSGFDTLLAVYTGTTFGNLNLVAADDDGAGFNRNSRVAFAASAGRTYLIAVDGFGGDFGGVVLNIVPDLVLAGFARTGQGGFRFDTFGPGTSNVVIEASGDLRSWTPIFTNRAPSTGGIQFDDPAAMGLLRRYYRANTR